MKNADQIQRAATLMASYAATCEMRNNLEWMEGLATRLNLYLESIGDSDRVVTYGYGLKTITAAEFSQYKQDQP
jgi:hypothetical protein